MNTIVSGAMLLLSVALLSACATLPSPQAFAPVQQSIAGQLSAPLEWRHSTAEDARAAASVRALLAKPLELEQALRIALMNSPRLQAQFENLGIAQADLQQAGLLANPVLSLQRLESGAGVERSFGVMQEFVGVFTLAARKKIAAQHLHKVQFEVAAQVMALASEVKAAYLSLQGDEQALELLESADAAAQAAAQLAQAQRGAGNANRLQVAQQQVFYGQIALELARAQAQVRADREQLNRLLGLWGTDTAWRLPRRLPDAPAQLPDLVGLEARAIGQRLDLAAAKRELDALNATAQLQRSTAWLGSAAVGYSRTRETDTTLLRGPSVEVDVPLFDRGQVQGGRAQAQLRQAERQLAQMAIDIRAQVRAARDKLIAAHSQLRHLRELMLPLHELIVAETQLRYNGMLTDVYELLLAKQAQLSTAREYVTGLRDFWLAYAQLEHALGGKLQQIAATAPAATPSVAPAPEQTDPHSHHHQ